MLVAQPTSNELRTPRPELDQRMDVDEAMIEETIICEPGVPRLFGSRDIASRGLKGGWSAPEAAHCWNDGIEAEMQISVAGKPKSRLLTIFLVPYTCDDTHAQDIILYVNGIRLNASRFRLAEPCKVKAEIPTESWKEYAGFCVGKIILYMPRSIRPIAIGRGKDSRELAFSFRELQID